MNLHIDKQKKLL